MQTLNIEAASKHAIELASTFVPLSGVPLSGGGTSTPLSLNTPDILNSLISITSNPFFGSNPSGQSTSTNTAPASSTDGGEDDKKVFATLETLSASAAAAALLQATAPPPPPPSTVQSLRSQFIKDSLKLTIQTKRKSSGKEEFDIQSELDVKVRKSEEVEDTDNPSYSPSTTNISNIETSNKLTPEDEERRRRRRERNKIAATKCRNKKKEKTGLLVQESQVLERTNVSLKSEISKLEEQSQRLTEILASHAPICTMKLGQSRLQKSDVSLPGYTRDIYNSNPKSVSTYYQHQVTAQRS